eukprot:6198538-Pleurochrysis_carterae.AAC.1
MSLSRPINNSPLLIVRYDTYNYRHMSHPTLISHARFPKVYPRRMRTRGALVLRSSSDVLPVARMDDLA